MLFGEYELSPGLIGLSLLPAAHPEAFQRLSVRPSIPRYRDFSLATGRSPGFASAATDSCALFRLAFATAAPLVGLNLAGDGNSQVHYAKGTTSQHKGCSDCLKAHGFRDFFTPLLGVLFTFPSRYLFAIGLWRVFSLGGWARRIHTGFHVPRATQGIAMLRTAACTQLSCSRAGLSRPFHSPSFLQRRAPTTPVRPEPHGFGLFPGRSPLLGESRLFSLPPGTKMFQFPGFASR